VAPPRSRFRAHRLVPIGAAPADLARGHGDLIGVSRLDRPAKPINMVRSNCPHGGQHAAPEIPARLAPRHRWRRRSLGRQERAEHVPGSYCVAVTIFDAAGRPVGAIGLSGHALEPLIRKHELLQATAELISHLL
jgi:hypothetical protein